MKKRAISMVLIVSMLLMVAPLASAQGDEQVITWWTEVNTVPTNIQELFIDPWNEAHPGYRLEISEHESLEEVTRTAIAAGEAPDILQTAGASFIAEFVEAGLVAPLDGYAAEWGWEENSCPGRTNPGSLAARCTASR